MITLLIFTVNFKAVNLIRITSDTFRYTSIDQVHKQNIEKSNGVYVFISNNFIGN